MIDLDKLQHAKNYIDKLAAGVDPISDTAMPGDAVLNNVRLSRCFFYVSDVLRQVIENGADIKNVRPKKSLPPFALPNELRAQIEISTSPVMIKNFTDKINASIDENAMQKLKVTALTIWLVDNGFLTEEIINGKKHKKPTDKGTKLGISSEQRSEQYGGYTAVFYNEDAQRHIINNLDEIIEISNGK